MAAMVEPMVAWANRANPIWLDLVLQKPDAGVDRRLPGPEDGVPRSGLGDRRQIVDRNYARVRCDLEGRGVGSRDRRLEVAGVDQFAAHFDFEESSRSQVAHLFTAVSGPQVIVFTQDAYAPGLPQAGRDLGEVFAHLGARCPLVEARVLA